MKSMTKGGSLAWEIFNFMTKGGSIVINQRCYLEKRVSESKKYSPSETFISKLIASPFVKVLENSYLRPWKYGLSLLILQ